MKRYIAVLCLCALVLGLAACRKPADDDNPTPPAVTDPTTPDGPNGQDDPNGQTDPGTSTDTPVPEDPNAIQFFDCGKLDFPNGGNVAGRENFGEFLNLTGVDKEASIVITQYTVEGDPIVSTLNYDGKQYTLQVDSTADEFAAQSDRTVKTSTWKRLVTRERQAGSVIYQVFRLTNLDEDDVTADTPNGEDVYTLFEEAIDA